MEQWTQAYASETNIQISYTGGGSGQGIKDLTANTVAFAGTDSPMKADERTAAESKYGPVLHLPVVFGGIVMAYNLNGVSKPINFTPAVIAKIFLGRITNWNDPAIKADNPDVTLPNQQITVVHRSDGSGTTATFTGWLCSVSSEWKDKLGAGKCAGKEVEWPVRPGRQGQSRRDLDHQLHARGHRLHRACLMRCRTRFRTARSRIRRASSSSPRSTALRLRRTSTPSRTT